MYASEPSNAFNVVLFVTPCVTGLVSLLSSLYVIHLITKTSVVNTGPTPADGGDAGGSNNNINNNSNNNNNNKTLSKKPRDQILLGLSCLDVFFSFALMFSTAPGPAMLDEKLLTIGTIATCTAQGFFVQLGLGAPLYNACLAFYYLLSVRYRLTDEYLLKWVIPVMHIIILTFSVGTAISGIFLEIFNFAGVMGCWIHSAEALCNVDPQYCGRGENAENFATYFGLIHISACFVFILTSMAVLCCTVHGIEKRSRRWEFHLEAWERSGDEAPATVRNGGYGTTASRHGGGILKRCFAPLTRRTIEASLFYSLSFAAVWLPTILLGLIPVSPDERNRTSVKSLRFLSALLQPFQGFFNMLIYTSPKWLPWFSKLRCFTFSNVNPEMCCYCCRLVRGRDKNERERELGEIERGPVRISTGEEIIVGENHAGEFEVEQSMDFSAIKNAIEIHCPPHESFLKARRRSAVLVLGRSRRQSAPSSSALHEMASIIKKQEGNDSENFFLARSLSASSLHGDETKLRTLEETSRELLRSSDSMKLPTSRIYINRFSELGRVEHVSDAFESVKDASCASSLEFNDDSYQNDDLDCCNLASRTTKENSSSCHSQRSPPGTTVVELGPPELVCRSFPLPKNEFGTTTTTTTNNSNGNSPQPIFRVDLQDEHQTPDFQEIFQTINISESFSASECSTVHT